MARHETVDVDERRAAIIEFTANAARGTRSWEVASAEPFRQLAGVDSETLSVFLAGEHPQTIALVLAHLPARLGGETLSSLPAELQATVVARIAAMGSLDPAVVCEVANVLNRRTAGLTTDSLATPGGATRAAALLRVADGATGQSVLTNLAHDNPALAGEIRRSAFLFDDVARLPRHDLERLAGCVSSEQWAAALAGADEKLTTGILNNLSGRLRRDIHARLDRQTERTAPSAAAVAAVRGQILAAAARLNLASAVPLAAAG